MTTVTISMPKTLKDFVDEQIETKGYGNVSEYFRSLIREAQEKENEKRLETLLLEALESDQAHEHSPQFWKEIKTQTQRRLSQRKAR